MNSASTSSEQISLPEQILESRHVGWIPVEQLPWLGVDYPEPHVGLSLLSYENGQIYIASAGTPQMNRISERTRKKEPVNGTGYTRTDELFLRACHLRATVADADIHTNLISRVQNPTADFTGFTLEAMRAAPSPNTPRVYMARTRSDNLTPEMLPGQKVLPDTPVMIRLVTTDKHGQLKALSLLESNSRQALRKSGAGSK